MPGERWAGGGAESAAERLQIGARAPRGGHGGGVWLAQKGASEFIYFLFLRYIHQIKITLRLFLLGHMREPLARIIIYVAREGEREGGREEGREKQKAFYYSGHW